MHTATVSVAVPLAHVNDFEAPAVRSGTACALGLPGTFCRKLFSAGSSQFFFHADDFGIVPSSLTCVTAYACWFQIARERTH